MRSSAPVLKAKSHNQENAIYTHVFGVALAAITNLLEPTDFQSSYVRSSALHAIECTFDLTAY
jgi:hypothetical protein